MSEAIETFLEDVSNAENWRLRKAEESPEDVRNANTANCLSHLIGYISEHKTDSCISCLAKALEKVYQDAPFQYSEEIPFLLSRFGFDGSVKLEEPNLHQECQDCLREIIGAINAINDRRERTE